MAYVVIGADRLGNINALLEEKLDGELIHVSGRKKKDQNYSLPQLVKGVIVFTDYINHNLAKRVKADAKKRNVPIVFAKRSVSHLECTLEQMMVCQQEGCDRPCTRNRSFHATV
ncbi:DUF2325 domain-containing protein [Aneurinibacillus aneurinilyticus]|uniref:DUF2325 domain-containing protein n=2 Tax=Aneurinibacillus aneurinilyticus TaxID=1391 RepID=A0A848CYT0_ANEAE|nr:DUF2325 domain-containing protein [Aneurinibacillus aneurinilyticus]ERI11079.1 hypothetical protein HMPREF0083_00830 [Aneurinibacillus aneurinilyticus ATCC 12856]MCI1694448.1 DUF2325 domain-containing protein [Aneurinibacillus aneurinilyticus]MED0671371.1 DUF2325 domain-containing protein [Aneurinibacillus aneurinilyticus]MED0705348.1 DUF2325 domain-containing protein [Aneurinibacillus aneurinilyticus]MED0725391.1 DUF2325 domain-containing protein [Aneurinibacillus aneurinilyticus]